MAKKVVKIRGKKVTFSSRILKSGETAYYRGGKRTQNSYQKRLAKGVLSGKTVAEARGHPFGAYGGRLLTSRQKNARGETYNWAEPPSSRGRGKEKATYYMQVRVTNKSLKKTGSPTGEDEACTVVTLALGGTRSVRPQYTYTEISRGFESIALATLKGYRLELCNGNLRTDVVSVWRHGSQ